MRYYVMSRLRGRKMWSRHLPGHAQRETAEARARIFGHNNTVREYKVEPFETAPAPTHENGQVRSPRRRGR